MKGFSVLLLTAALTFSFLGCSNDIEEAADNRAEASNINYEEDAYDLMGVDYQALLEKYDESMIVDFLDKDSAGEQEADFYYVLKNGVEVSIYNDKVVSVRTFYNTESEYPVPVLKGIGGDDSYDAVVGKLGKPYYEGLETAGDEEEFIATVFYIGEYQYIKIYFDKETKYVSFISCFYGEEPDSPEAEEPASSETGTIKVGDSLDTLKAAYKELYYAEAYYDTTQGEPKYNRIYYTPTEDRDRGVACQEFYVYDKKIVKITSNDYDILGWRNYEDVFGMDNVYKENNMVGHNGSVVYFYDDADGNEQVLLTIENCATEEIDVDDDGITEIVANKSGKKRAIVIYDYDVNTETITSLDICENLGSDWSGYMGNAANVRDVYSKCIEAGFYEEDGTTRTEVYSVKDNLLTYIGPYKQEMFQ